MTGSRAVMRAMPYQLRLLGGPAIETEQGGSDALAARRHPLALAAVLAIEARRAVTRDRLVALLWPEADAETARNRLRVALHALRYAFGQDAIVAVADGLRLDSARVRCDLIEFRDALDAGLPDEALRAWGGPFLDGFHLPDSREFDEWADAQRDLLARRHREALEQLAEQSALTGDLCAAAEWWHRRAAEEPASGRVVVRLMQALERAGDPVAALGEAERYARLLHDEFDTEPSPEVQALAERIRTAPRADDAPRSRAESPEAVAVARAATRASVDAVPVNLAHEATGAGVEEVTASHDTARVTARRAAAIGTAAALVALVGMAVWMGAGGTREGGEGAAPYRIAVYPFRVQGGAELAYLSEGLMDLLSSSVDGLGEIRRVDPYALIGRLRRDGVAADIEPAEAARMARDFGAGRYVLGSVLAVGAEVRISASLYDISLGVEPVARGDAQGPVEGLPELVESIALQLLDDVPLGSGGRLAGLSIPEVSHQVLRAYLQGEALLRRGQIRAAQTPLEYAVDVDSTFALGWYRLSMAEGPGSYNAGRHGDAGASSIQHALDHADRLSPRDRLLVEAFHAIRFADSDRAEAWARTAAGTYPDNVEAWYALGETLYTYGWQRGRSPADALRPLGRALALDPGYAPAVIRYVVSAGFEHRPDEIRQAITSYLELMPTSDSVGFVNRQALQLALLEGDAVVADSILSGSERLPDDLLFERASILAKYDSLGVARRILAAMADSSERSGFWRASARFDRVLMTMAAGEWQSTRAQLDDPAAQRFVAHTPIVYALAALPFFERPAQELERLRESLRELSLLPYERTDPVRFGRPPWLHPWLREYALGLLSARLGDEDAAVAYASALEDAQEPDDPAGLRRDLALEIRALVHHAAGRDEEALRLLEAAEYRVASYHRDAFNPISRRPVGRYLRAEVLHHLGRKDEALAWYASLFWSTGPEAVVHGPALLRRAEIHEGRGEHERALHFYRRFFARWRGADPEYQPLVRDVEARVARLTAARG